MVRPEEVSNIARTILLIYLQVGNTRKEEIVVVWVQGKFNQQAIVNALIYVYLDHVTGRDNLVSTVDFLENVYIFLTASS